MKGHGCFSLLSLSSLVFCKEDVHNFIKWLLSPTSLRLNGMTSRDAINEENIENASTNGFLPSCYMKLVLTWEEKEIEALNSI